MPDETRSVHEAELSAVIASYLEAADEGRAPDPAELLDRHPHLAVELRAFLAAEDRLARVAGGPGSPGARAETLPAGADPTAIRYTLPAAGAAVGPYDLLEMLGEGGMGVVYKARDRRTKRIVALKLIRAGRHATPAELDRFRVEAEAAARLSHPGIVQLFEVGEGDGQPFLASEFCAGGSLADKLAGRPCPPDEAARTVSALAAAVQSAHDKHIVHRDLKPANVLLTADGTLKVGDFGLAKLLDATEFRTRTNAILGSPPYMSPEQAAGKPTGKATDVYALGAILYELLTGRPPFRGATPTETLQRVVRDEPVPPRRLNRAVPRDLQTICLRCLEKDPARRFATAADLGAELDRFVRGAPILSRPVGPIERAWRWCRRNPVPTVAALVVAGVGAVALALISASRDEALDLAAKNGEMADTMGQLADDKGRLADEKGRLAEEKGRLAEQNGQLAAANKTEAENARAQKRTADEQKRAAQREATVLAYRQGQELCEKGDVARGMIAFGHGLTLAEQADAPDLARLIRHNLGVWAAHLNVLDDVWAHPVGVACVAASPNGKLVATADWNRNVRIWDAATGAPAADPVRCEKWVTGLAFSADGKQLLAVAYDRVLLLDPASAKVVGELFEKDGGLISAAAFAPDGALVVTGGSRGQLRFWDVAARQPVGDPLPVRAWVRAVAWSPDRALLACGLRDGGLVVWDAKARTARHTVPLREPTNAVAFSPDGTLVAVGGDDRTVRLFSAATGEAVGPRLTHTGPVTAVAFSPDGLTLASGGTDRTARVWQLPDGAPVGQPLVHPGEVLGVAFGADGRSLFTAQGRQTGDARRWRVALGQVAGPTLAHVGPILCLAVSRDGTRIATGSRDHTARLWDGRTGEPVGDPLVTGQEVNAVAFAPDGGRLLTASDAGEVLYWHGRTGRPVVVDMWPGKQDIPAFAEKMQVHVEGGAPVRMPGRPDPRFPNHATDPFWGPGRGKTTVRRGDHGAPINALAFAPDGKSFAFGCASGETFRHRDGDPDWIKMQLGDPVERIGFGPEGGQDVYAVAYSPDGTRVAIGRHDGTVLICDPTVARALSALAGDQWQKGPTVARGKHDGPVVIVAFSPDGKLVLSAGGDGTARLWETATGKPHVKPATHQGAVVAAAFAPDGKTFLTGSWDGSVRVWRTDTGEPVGRSMPHPGRVLAAAFSADGGLILSGGEDGNGRLWDAATGLPVGPALGHRDRVRVVAFRPDGRLAVTAGDDRTGAVWAVPEPVDLPAARVALWLEAATGLRRDPDGLTRLLGAADWAEVRERHRKENGNAPPAPDPEGWHRRSAAAGERTGRWATAAWHLDRLVGLYPDDPDLRVRYGLVLSELDRPEAAAKEFDKAVALAPGRWEPHFRLGQLALAAGDAKGAAAAFDCAVRCYPRTGLRGGWEQFDGVPVAVWHGSGVARGGLGDWAPAIEDLRRAAFGPYGRGDGPPRLPRELSGNVRAAADLARAYLAADRGADFDALCRAMTHLFVLPPPRQSTIVTGEFGVQTVHTFGDGGRADPNTVAAVAWVCALRPGTLRDYAPALDATRALAQADPKSYPFARAHGAVLYRAGKYDEAVKQLEAANRLRPDSAPTVWLLLAMAKHQTGDETAAELVKKATKWVADAQKKEGERLSRWDVLPWQERVALESLLREAEQLVGKK